MHSATTLRPRIEPSATRDDCNARLSLQAKPAGTTQKKVAQFRGIGHLKQDLLNRLRERSPQASRRAALEDSDTTSSACCRLHRLNLRTQRDAT